jgi:hypothetical protein
MIGLAINPQNASIVRAVTAMGRSLQMRVVAEGVETDNEVKILLDLDCDEIQGYLIARPMPAGGVGQFLEADGNAVSESMIARRTVRLERIHQQDGRPRRREASSSHGAGDRGPAGPTPGPARAVHWKAPAPRYGGFWLRRRRSAGEHSACPGPLAAA